MTNDVVSNDPVTACNDNVLPYLGFSGLPGTLSVTYQGRQVTHVPVGAQFHLVYTGETNDRFQAQQVTVWTAPYFDKALHVDDPSAAMFTVTNQDISGSQLTVPVTFPFPHPSYSFYNKPGAYCVVVALEYIQPDGKTVDDAQLMSIYIQPAS